MTEPATETKDEPQYEPLTSQQAEVGQAIKDHLATHERLLKRLEQADLGKGTGPFINMAMSRDSLATVVLWFSKRSFG